MEEGRFCLFILLHILRHGTIPVKYMDEANGVKFSSTIFKHQHEESLTAAPVVPDLQIRNCPRGFLTVKYDKFDC